MELSEAAEQNLTALEGELQTLKRCLRFATIGFRASAGSERRTAVRIALNAVSSFVDNVFSLDQELRQPLNELLYGLDDLDRGQVIQLLKPNKTSHRAKKSLSAGHLRAAAAALMDLYQQAGMARETAARQAALKLNGAGYRDDKGQSVAAKQVKRWRDDLKAPLDKNDDAVRKYNVALSFLESTHPGDPDSAARFLLDALPDAIAPTIPQKAVS
jgi:hypothetical protein